MASELAPFPRLIFTTIEPITLVMGAVANLAAPDWFIREQIKAAPGTLLPNSDNARLVAMQLGNTYGLVCLIGVFVLSTTSELSVVHAYLWACWIADITHVGMTAYALGWDRFFAFGDWNGTTWGNIGITTFLFITRCAYFLGLFGTGKKAASRAKKSA